MSTKKKTFFFFKQILWINDFRERLSIILKCIKHNSIGYLQLQLYF